MILICSSAANELKLKRPNFTHLLSSSETTKTFWAWRNCVQKWTFHSSHLRRSYFWTWTFCSQSNIHTCWWEWKLKQQRNQIKFHARQCDWRSIEMKNKEMSFLNLSLSCFCRYFFVVHSWKFRFISKRDDQF